MPIQTVARPPLGEASDERNGFIRRRFRRWWLPAVVAVCAGVALWSTVLEERLVAKRWGVVEPGQLYRSGQISKHLIEKKLVDNHIQTVIDLNGFESYSSVGIDQQAELDACRKHGIVHHRFPLSGEGTGDIESYASAIEVIHTSLKAGKPVLVHCAAGAQRTGGVVAAYRMLVQNKPPEAAYAELSKYGWRKDKHGILLDYVNGHMRVLAELLVQRGIIDDVPEPLPVLGTP